MTTSGPIRDSASAKNQRKRPSSGSAGDAHHRCRRGFPLPAGDGSGHERETAALSPACHCAGQSVRRRPSPVSPYTRCGISDDLSESHNRVRHVSVVSEPCPLRVREAGSGARGRSTVQRWICAPLRPARTCRGGRDRGGALGSATSASPTSLASSPPQCFGWATMRGPASACGIFPAAPSRTCLCPCCARAGCAGCAS